MEINISDNFKKKTTRAILAILFFIITYLLLLAFGLVLTYLCCIMGFGLIAMRPSFITLVLGLGIASIGILILIFLIKFLFKKNKIDRSHLIEITKSEQPKLFSFIEKIADEVDTKHPKKVYISSDVNASVFYDSSFWSMFFPIRKNLQIGLGLVNSVSESELKAILAHEFGHFSQKSMKVGSYVYNVNQVIFNMLYDNESFSNLAEGWASASAYFGVFVAIAIKIVQAIQWILRKVYEVVNISYMGLSREMEFHADEVAANVAGSKPLVDSLLRLNLAAESYQTVLNHYESKFGDAVVTNNIFPKQRFVLDELGKNSRLPFANNLPQVDLEYFSRFNKSKLVIKDQWASHPSTEDRVEALERLNIQKEQNDIAASELFQDMVSLEEKVTERLFSFVQYQQERTMEDESKFKETFSANLKDNFFHEMFNTYYDNLNPSPIEISSLVSMKKSVTNSVKELFSPSIMNQVYRKFSLEKDISIIEQIAQGEINIKSFDYDGEKYKKKHASKLIPQLQEELAVAEKVINDNDFKILKYFYELANQQGKNETFVKLYQKWLNIENNERTNYEKYIRFVEASQFIQGHNSYGEIEYRLKTMNPIEIEFKAEVKKLLEKNIFQQSISEELKEKLSFYVSQELEYFKRPGYNEEALDYLFTAIESYPAIIGKTYFQLKKDLLNFMVKLEMEK